MKRYFLVIPLLMLVNFTFANPFHPDFLLRTTDGEIWQTGAEVSQSHTCGQCHNSEFIHQSLDKHHQFLPDDTARAVSLLTQQPAAPLDTQIQCLDCHANGQTISLTEIANDTGIITADKLTLTSPTSEACGSCHGLVNTGPNPVEFSTVHLQQSMFGLTGEIFSGQLISKSALNIANKNQLNFSFDAHAERVVSCTDCHSSENNPVRPPTQNSLQHLKFDPRTLSPHDYLKQPDHNFTKAYACTSCHEIDNSHTWLPYQAQHFSKLSCESCHSNWIAAPAAKSVKLDNSPDKNLKINNVTYQWRGLENELIQGYSPQLLPNGNGKIAPYNVIEVSRNGEQYTLAKAIHHNIQSARATQNCLTCHNKDSVLKPNISSAPINISLPENYIQNSAPNLAAVGIYILGGDTVPLVDWLGIALLLLTITGVTGHGVARYLARRKLGAHKIPRKRVYMYSYYQRLWHWLQATAILLLLATGAAIHKPWLFSWLSFAYMVEIHNILGFVLFTNAALALFYHLASGEIKQFIPMPADLFVRSFEQIQFYAKGIFQNAPHPFAKDPEYKLNPLQKVAYFGLLNVLLPAQMLTGLLMWGAQNWPEFSNTIGGLNLLGPLHSFLAWAFVAFLIMHIYLTTTSGPKIHSGIKAMIDGWEDIEISDKKEQSP